MAPRGAAPLVEAKASSSASAADPSVSATKGGRNYFPAVVPESHTPKPGEASGVGLLAMRGRNGGSAVVRTVCFGALPHATARAVRRAPAPPRPDAVWALAARASLPGSA